MAIQPASASASDSHISNVSLTAEEFEFLCSFGEVLPGRARSKGYRDKETDFKHPYELTDFREGDNVCVQVRRGVVDCDVDALEAVAVADDFLPPTDAVFGHAGKPRSHRLYSLELDAPLQLKDEHATDVKKAMLVELRTNGQMTVFPPSVHKSGRPIAWAKRALPSPVSDEALERSARLLAIAAVAGRYWRGPGDRHEIGLVFCGALRQLGLTREEAETIVRAVAKIAQDPNVNDRLLELKTTYQKPEEVSIQGLSKLKQLEPRIGNQLARLLGVKQTSNRGFICNENGRVLANKPHNIRHALKLLGVRPVFNVFRRGEDLRFQDRERPFEDRPLEDLWLQIEEQFGFLPEETLFRKVVRNEGFRNSFHPVFDYLQALAWDGKPRIDSWLIDYCDAEDTKLNRAIGSIVLRAAVNRIYEPGCKFDELLVLMSPQGWNKSTAVQALCPNPEWFLEGLPIGVDSKVVIERTLGKWIVEANELKKAAGAREEAIKAFLSTTADTARLAYEREPVTVKRHWVAIGTCNPGDILTDTTGNRRWWIVEVGKIDVQGIKRDRDQLWAEARERQNESVRLDESLYEAAGAIQEEHREVDPWEDEIRMFYSLDEMSEPPRWIEKYRAKYEEKHTMFVANDDIYGLLNVPIDRRTGDTARRLGKAMRKLGFVPGTSRNDRGQVERGWKRERRWSRR